MSYYHPPVDVPDDARGLCDRATKGVGAAKRAGMKKRAPRKRKN